MQHNTNTEGSLLQTKQEGKVYLEDMLKGLQLIKASTQLPRNLKILEDSRQAQVMFSVKDLEFLLDNLDEAAANYESIKHAVLLTNPLSTVFAMLINSKKYTNHYELKVFTTREAAISWLNSF